MSKFVDDIQARLAEISKLIPTANITERRALQKERADERSKFPQGFSRAVFLANGLSALRAVA